MPPECPGRRPTSSIAYSLLAESGLCESNQLPLHTLNNGPKWPNAGFHECKFSTFFFLPVHPTNELLASGVFKVLEDEVAANSNSSSVMASFSYKGSLQSKGSRESNKALGSAYASSEALSPPVGSSNISPQSSMSYVDDGKQMSFRENNSVNLARVLAAGRKSQRQCSPDEKSMEQHQKIKTILGNIEPKQQEGQGCGALVAGLCHGCFSPFDTWLHCRTTWVARRTLVSGERLREDLREDLRDDLREDLREDKRKKKDVKGKASHTMSTSK
eukprot:Skav213692  [mRNA]  locus=scaffold491:606625:611457:- [translate_table: standard]